MGKLETNRVMVVSIGEIKDKIDGAYVEALSSAEILSQVSPSLTV